MSSPVNLNVLGCMLVNKINYLTGFSHFKPEIIFCHDEIHLINTFIQTVNNLDPEIICGYEVSLVIRIQMWYFFKLF